MCQPFASSSDTSHASPYAWPAFSRRAWGGISGRGRNWLYDYRNACECIDAYIVLGRALGDGHIQRKCRCPLQALVQSCCRFRSPRHCPTRHHRCSRTLARGELVFSVDLASSTSASTRAKCKRISELLLARTNNLIRGSHPTGLSNIGTAVAVCFCDK